MKFIKNILSSALIFTPAISFAQITFDNPLGTTSDLNDVIFNITVFLYEFAFPFMTLGVIYAGFLFVTSGGNQQRTTSAKNVLIYTLLGGAILMSSSELISLVQEILS